MNNRLDLNWKLCTTIAVLMLGCLLTTDSFAKGLYKSVDSAGKITYSNHPPINSQESHNISALKGSPKYKAKYCPRASKSS
jgi:Domain of unknown function (DUF4124)